MAHTRTTRSILGLPKLIVGTVCLEFLETQVFSVQSVYSYNPLLHVCRSNPFFLYVRLVFCKEIEPYFFLK